MKLYTEEQVRQSFIAGMEFIAVNPLKYEQDANEYMSSLTPIELPSDEEIEESSFKMSGNNVSPSSNFIIGAYWMKEQILKQNHGQAGRTFTQDLIPKN